MLNLPALAGSGSVFHTIIAADDRDQATFKKQSDPALYGKKRSADRKTCESADRN